MLYRGRRGPVANSDIGRTMDCADPSFTLCEPAEVRNRARAAGSARTPSRGLSQDWRSYRDGWWWMRIVGGLEALPEAGAERAVVDGAADLEQQVGPAPGPAHLLRLGQALVDQEIGRALAQ